MATTQPLLLYLRLNPLLVQISEALLKNAKNTGPRNSASMVPPPKWIRRFLGGCDKKVATHLQQNLEFDSSHTLRFRTRTIKKPMGAEKQLFREYKPKYPHNTPPKFNAWNLKPWWGNSFNRISGPISRGTIPPFSGSSPVSSFSGVKIEKFSWASNKLI